MTTLDVALRLRLLNQLSPEAAKAARDLLNLKSAAGGVNGRGPDKLKRDIIDVSTASRQADRSLRELRRETDALGRARGPDRLRRDMLDMASAARQAERSMAGARKAATGLRDPRPGGALIAGTPGMLARFGAGYMGYRTASGALNTAIGQEKAWAEVLKKIDASPTEYAQMEKTLRRLSRDYGIGISETFGQAAEAGAAGVAKEDIEQFVRLTTKASVGWDMTARETAQKLAEIKSGTNATLPWIEQLADKINALGDNSAAKERDIVEMFHRSGAAAKAAGVDYDATLAILTAVRSTGMQEEVASRWFNAFTAGLAGAHAKSKKAQEGFKQLGLDPKGVAKGMTTNSVDTILKVFEALERAPQMDKIAAATKIFGEGWWDETARAGQALPEIIKQLKFIRDPVNWKGSLSKSLDIKLATTANHLERLKVLASEVGNRLSRWALPPINSVIEAAIRKFDDLNERVGWWERKQAVMEAAALERGDVVPADPKADPPKEQDWNVGKAARKWLFGDERPIDERVGEWLWGRRVTKDAAGGQAADLMSAVRTAEKQAADLRTKADKEKDKAKRKALLGEAREYDEVAARNRHAAGRAAARDMTGVEAGEDLARAKIAGQREVHKEQDAAIERLLDQRARLEHMLARPGQFPGREEMTSKLKAITESLRTILTGEDLSPAARRVIERYTEGLAAEGQNATAKAREIAEQLKQILNITLTPTIRPNLSGPGASVGDNSELPKPQSQRNGPAGGSGRVVIRNAHFHGVHDVAAFGRQLARLQDDAVSESRDGALHDTWTYA